MKCVQCNKEFESKRVTSKYCSASCRVRASRVSVTDDKVSVTINDYDHRISVTKPLSVTEVERVSVTPHPDRDNIYSRHYDTSEEGFIRRNKAWLDASRFSGTPAQQEAARNVNRQIIIQSCIKINQDHLSHAVSEGERREKQEAAMEAMRKIEG